jgi:hypothetical protein
MRDKLWSRVLVGLAVALFGAASISAPATAASPTPPKPIGGAGFNLPAPGHAEKTKPGPAIHLKHHAIPTKKNTGGVSTFSVNPAYDYAGGQDTRTGGKTALAGNIAVCSPPTVDSGDHSLMEATVQAGTSNRQAILELGCVKQCPTCSVQLFASRWVNNVWGGSYIGSGDGWVDYGPNATDLGAIVPSSSKNYQWIYDSPTGRWWAYYDGQALGYYPPTLWTGASPSFTFDKGTFFQVFGEVYDDDTTVGPCTDMGNGVLATGSGTRANVTAWKYAVGDYVTMGTWGTITNSSWYNTLPVNVASQGGTGANAYIGGSGAC